MNEVKDQEPTLNMTDLVTMLNIIEKTTQRGVWSASELSAVGLAYDRLRRFVESADRAAKENTIKESNNEPV